MFFLLALFYIVMSYPMTLLACKVLINGAPDNGELFRICKLGLLLSPFAAPLFLTAAVSTAVGDIDHPAVNEVMKFSERCLTAGKKKK